MTRWSPRRSVAAACALAALVTGACGVDADSEPRSIPSEDLEASRSDATSTTANDARDTPIGTPETVDVFFTRNDDDRRELTTTERNVSSPATEGAVLDALLLEPPNTQERRNGLVSAIPPTTRQLRPPQWQDGGVLLVSLTSGLFDVEGETLKLAYGQIVCSVTALGNVETVLFEVEGEMVPAIDGSGEQVNGPVTCGAYDNLIRAA
jgi:spore germination protein GerM